MAVVQKTVGLVALAALLSGCASAPSQKDACEQVNVAVKKVTMTLSSAGEERYLIPRNEIIKTALEYVDDLETIAGPAGFEEIRDPLASSIRDNIDALLTGTSDPKVTARLNAPMVDAASYCDWDKEPTLKDFLGL